MQFKPCLWCIYIGLQYTVGYSYTSLYSTDSECTRAIASTLIHAVVLCGSAQRYRPLMVILQSHRTQNMILRCYPNVSAILRRHTKSCLLCFFNNPYISPFKFTEFFTCFASRSFAPPQKWLLLVWSRGASSARAHVHVGRRRRFCRTCM